MSRNEALGALLFARLSGRAERVRESEAAQQGRKKGELHNLRAEITTKLYQTVRPDQTLSQLRETWPQRAG